MEEQKQCDGPRSGAAGAGETESLPRLCSGHTVTRDTTPSAYPTDHSSVSVHSPRLDTAPLPVQHSGWKSVVVSSARRIKDCRRARHRTGLRSRRWEPTPACILAQPSQLDKLGRAVRRQRGQGRRRDGGGRTVGPALARWFGLWLCWPGRRMYRIKYCLAVARHALSLRDGNAV